MYNWGRKNKKYNDKKGIKKGIIIATIFLVFLASIECNNLSKEVLSQRYGWCHIEVTANCIPSAIKIRPNESIRSDLFIGMFTLSSNLMSSYYSILCLESIE